MPNLAEEERKRRALGQPQTIAAPPKPVIAQPKSALRQFGDAAAKTAAFAAGPAATLVGGIAEIPAIGIDKVRGAVAGAQGRELVRPFATQQAALDIRDFGVDSVASGLRAGVNALPVGETRPKAPVVAPPPRAPASTAALPNDPAAQQPATTQAIDAAPQRSFDETNVPTTFKRGGFVQSLGGPNGREEGQRFLAQRQRDRDAAITKTNAETDANVANARNTELRNNLQSQLNRTPPGGGIQRQGEFRPRGGADPRDQLIAQIASLNKPVAAAATPSAAEQQKAGAEIDAAGDKAKADKVALEAGQLALQGEQRKAALQQQIAQLGPNDPNAAALRSNLAVLSGKNPNEGRFESIEELVGQDAFGNPVKVRSLYDTTTGGFIDRGGGQAQAKPTAEAATAEAKAAVKAGANKEAVNARLKQLGYPTI